MGLQAYYSIEIVGKLNMMTRIFAIDHALSPKIYKNQRKNKKVKNTCFLRLQFLPIERRTISFQECTRKPCGFTSSINFFWLGFQTL